MASPVSCPLKLEAGYISPNPHLCPQTAPTPPVNGKQVTTGSSPQVRGRLDVAAWVNVVFGLIPAGAGQTRPPSDRRRVLAAHPRGCGADLTLFVFLTQSIGSSPRVRGRRGRRSVEVRGHGLIPAGAGQTRDKHGQAGALGAHPRGCGADGTRPTTCTRQRGSSPRVRGRLRIEVVDGQATGLIPAGAGQTVRRPRLVRCPWAHPRGCGGRLVCSVFRLVLAGLIPAGAGQTRNSFLRGFVARAHPRGCGADRTADVHTASTKGSSPRVRGRLMLAPPSRRAGRAHPRGCGADTVMRSRSSGSGGSSPRVRGRLQQTIQAGGGLGLIPAGAGQTRHRMVPRRRLRAHPRGCGADSELLSPWVCCPGSSPRVRGRQDCGRAYRVDEGLIPAGAGQTHAGASLASSGTGSSPRVRGRHGHEVKIKR